MHMIELSEDEVKLVREALRAFLDDFTHEQHELLRSIEALLAKLPLVE
jgi:hypothetical protein